MNSGIARVEFFPRVPGDNVQAEIIMQDGTSTENVAETIAQIEEAIYKIDKEYRAENPDTVGLVDHVASFGMRRRSGHVSRSADKVRIS